MGLKERVLTKRGSLLLVLLLVLFLLIIGRKTHAIAISQLFTYLPIVVDNSAPPTTLTPTESPSNCHPSYPDPGVCILPPPPDLDCKDIPYRRFTVLPTNPHKFDGDGDGIGCES